MPRARAAHRSDPGAGLRFQGREGLRVERVGEAVVWMNRAATTLFFPDARVTG